MQKLDLEKHTLLTFLPSHWMSILRHKTIQNSLIVIRLIVLNDSYLHCCFYGVIWIGPAETHVRKEQRKIFSCCSCDSSITISICSFSVISFYQSALWLVSCIAIYNNLYIIFQNLFAWHYVRIYIHTCNFKMNSKSCALFSSISVQNKLNTS